jgi:hypothetical protein
MLGDKIGEGSGQVTTQRVLPNPGGGPKMETTFKSTGTLLGVAGQEFGTYTSAMRADGHVYGEGQGLIMSPDGDAVSWIGQGLGTLKKGGGVTYRGSLYYQSASPKWARLNGIVGVFEYDVDAQGNTKAQIWEWK